MAFKALLSIVAIVAAFQGGLPAHTVTHHGLGFFTPGVADQARALGRLHHQMAAVGGHDQAGAPSGLM